MVSSVTTKKMVLGTAQFGMDYGIANLSGKPSKKEFFDILDLAWQNGISRFDTAPGYGSESLLGEFISTNGLQNEAKVLTKIPSMTDQPDFEEGAKKSIESSLRSLGCPIDILFFHNPSDAVLLIEEPQVFEKILQDFPVSTIGFSVYEPEDVDCLENCNFELAFQFPFNILDRRFEKVKMPVGKRFARSIFLQGLLASQKGLRIDTPEELLSFHKSYHDRLLKKRIKPVEAAVLFAARTSFVDYFLIGVDTINQLKDILSLEINKPFDLSDFDKFDIDFEKKLIDPRKWN